MVESNERPVGFKRPPTSHRIKPGEVRNPFGRRGKPKPPVDFLDEPFELHMKEGGSIKTTRREAVDHALFGQAIRGNVSAAKELERRKRERADAAKSETLPVLPSEDRAALDRLIERHLRDQAAAVGSPSPRETDSEVFVPGDKQ